MSPSLILPPYLQSPFHVPQADKKVKAQSVTTRLKCVQQVFWLLLALYQRQKASKKEKEKKTEKLKEGGRKNGKEN